jgi:DNA repair protein RecO (recombination protein O)
VSLVTTDAIVLHAFDYRETSRILRVVTRELGVRSVIARGARRSRNRFGPALDLFAEGPAQLALHPTGDLHTLVAFDVMRARPELAEVWGRFAAANALSEILLRFARDDTHTELFVAFQQALDAVAAADNATAASAGLAGAWALVAELGFAPSLDVCAGCGAPLANQVTVVFGHRAGGALCDRCADGTPGTRRLPQSARSALAGWLSGEAVILPDAPEARAHLRLLSEFLQEHLGDERALRALAVWTASNSQ